jgi:predicted HicB family RNase H-like nuclease
MADLRVPKIDADLHARVKAGAALARMSIPCFVSRLLAEALRARENKKQP